MFVMESSNGKWYGILKEETQTKYYLIMGLKVGNIVSMKMDVLSKDIRDVHSERQQMKS